MLPEIVLPERSNEDPPVLTDEYADIHGALSVFFTQKAPIATMMLSARNPFSQEPSP